MSVIPRRYADGWASMDAHPELDPDSWPCRGCGEPWGGHSAYLLDDPDRCPDHPGYYFDPHPDIDLHPNFEEPQP